MAPAFTASTTLSATPRTALCPKPTRMFYPIRLPQTPARRRGSITGEKNRRCLMCVTPRPPTDHW